MKTSLWLLLLALSISSGCAVYRQSDDLGSSEFALYYGRNYRYRETTPSGKTCIKGQYTVRDSTIKFDLKHRDPVPYNFDVGWGGVSAGEVVGEEARKTITQPLHHPTFTLLHLPNLYTFTPTPVAPTAPI